MRLKNRLLLGHFEYNADDRRGGNKGHGVELFKPGHIPGADQHQEEEHDGLDIQHQGANIINVGHPEQGIEHDLQSRGADEGHGGGPQTVEGVVHQPGGAELVQEVGNDENTDHRGHHKTHGGNKGPADAAPQAAGFGSHGEAHIGGHVDPHGAGGALGYGNHIRQLTGGVPAGLGGDVLQKGHRGHAAANGKEAGFEKFPE